MVHGDKGETKGIAATSMLMKATIHWLIIVAMLLVQHRAPAQSSWMLESYYYTGKDLKSFVPILHVETQKKWYAELRYNYEDKKTLSLFAGKNFAGGGALEYNITPLVGYSVGRFEGVSAGFNSEAEWKNLFFTSQTQYSFSVKEKSESFFFTWSEAGYNLTSHFYAGLALQYTMLTGLNNLEPGFLAGLEFKNISFPFYIFGPFDQDRYFILGLNYEFNLKKRKTPAP